MIDEEIKRFKHLGILKQDVSPYSSPIMLIAGKKFKKRTITDQGFERIGYREEIQAFL